MPRAPQPFVGLPRMAGTISIYCRRCAKDCSKRTDGAWRHDADGSPACVNPDTLGAPTEQRPRWSHPMNPTQPTQEVTPMSSAPAMNRKQALAFLAEQGIKGVSKLTLPALQAKVAEQWVEPEAEKAPKATTATAGLRYLIDGVAVAEVHNRLSGVSRATGMKGGQRISTDALRALLAKQGIANADTEPFTATLPNGVVLSLVAEADVPPKPERVAKTPAERKAAREAKAAVRVAAMNDQMAAARAAKNARKAS